LSKVVFHAEIISGGLPNLVKKILKHMAELLQVKYFQYGGFDLEL